MPTKTAPMKNAKPKPGQKPPPAKESKAEKRRGKAC